LVLSDDRVYTLEMTATDLGYSKRETFLLVQLFAVLFFAICIPISALITRQIETPKTLIYVTIAIRFFGFSFLIF
jgi:hypothetical protein